MTATPAVVPWDALDATIRPAVAAFVRAGLRTIASCGGHEHNDPYIIVEPQTDDPMDEARQVDEWLCNHDAGGFWIFVKWWVAPASMSYPPREAPVIEVAWWKRDALDVFGDASGLGTP